MFKALLLLLLLQLPGDLPSVFRAPSIPSFERSHSVPEMGAWGRRKRSFFSSSRSRRLPASKAEWIFTIVMLLLFLLFGGKKSTSYGGGSSSQFR